MVLSGKASASRAADLCPIPTFTVDLFPRQVTPVKIGAVVSTLPGAWHYEVSAGLGLPSVSIPLMLEIEGLIFVWLHVQLSEQIRH